MNGNKYNFPTRIQQAPSFGESPKLGVYIIITYRKLCFVWGSEKDKLTWFVGELKILTESEETILQNNDVLNSHKSWSKH